MNSAPRHELARREAATDAKLVALVRAGNLTGLGALFDRYGVDVRRFLGRLGVPGADVDDLVQETFLDVLHAAERFRPDAPVKPWLFGLAAMVARRHRRFVKRMFARVRRWTREAVEDHPPTPAEIFERTGDALRASRALEGLSIRKREAFILVALEGMSGEEAAAALGIPVATLWTRLHHARRELRLALGERE